MKSSEDVNKDHVIVMKNFHVKNFIEHLNIRSGDD